MRFLQLSILPWTEQELLALQQLILVFTFLIL